MSPIYVYVHPDTGEEFEEIRSFKDIDKVFMSPDGKKCKRKKTFQFSGWRKDREIFELDSQLVKKMKPKFIKLRNGRKIRFDPTKHC
jgi:hypothetical protein